MSSDEDLKDQRGGGPGATGRPDQGGPGQGIPRGGGTMTGVFHRLPRDSGEQTGVGQGCPQLASERGCAASRCQRTGLGHGLHGWWTEGGERAWGRGWLLCETEVQSGMVTRLWDAVTLRHLGGI